ncbi:MAG TPA: hypothetical protein DCR40_06980 [Prolixibacteraceae bacterium]|nr:hypothetical protein [Prolixibacteraceae bacterium]
MKTIIFSLRCFLLYLFLSIWTSGFGQSYKNLPETWNYAIEISGVLCGYSESNLTSIEKDGKELLSLNDNIVVKLSVLGGGVDMKIVSQYFIDPDTKNPVSIEHIVTTTAEMYASTKIENNVAWFATVKGGEAKETQLPSGVILENSISYPHLMNDFIRGNVKEKSYSVFDDMRGVIATKTYKRIGVETLDLAGKTFQATVLEELNQTLGTTTKLWLNTENSFPLKIDVLGRVIYLADQSVKKKIQTVDLEKMLFAKVNRLISNVTDISYMKAEAKIESAGEWITPEGLNFKGQKFTGTVTNNLIEGVFEIEPERYSGINAPGFPSDFKNETFEKYLYPESLIESDHPDLINEAQKITEGSKDSWEAAVRLSKWVAENIHGAVPGGTSAINTYTTKEGECGSHSRLLAAFCRAVGIPARLSVGCMYTPYLGGSFGQHAWTEVYMGDAGWIAVDATAFEFDFVDAGHIRLGEKTSFNPKEMKIIDYRIGSEKTTEMEVPEQFKDYIGKYLFAERNSVFEILYQDGNLAVNIPGQSVLSLNNPDENGIFYPKMTRQINFSFLKDNKGKINEMKLQQIIPLQKKSESENSDENIPEKIKPILGNYLLTQAQAEFKVFYNDGALFINDPLLNKVVKLPDLNENGMWIDEFNKNEVEFEIKPDGEVIRMIIYSNILMQKQVEL